MNSLSTEDFQNYKKKEVGPIAILKSNLKIIKKI